MADTAKVPANPSNEGKVDGGRGTSFNFKYDKSKRTTGTVGAPTSVPNSNAPNADVRKLNDPRTT